MVGATLSVPCEDVENPKLSSYHDHDQTLRSFRGAPAAAARLNLRTSVSKDELAKNAMLVYSSVSLPELLGEHFSEDAPKSMVERLAMDFTQQYVRSLFPIGPQDPDGRAQCRPLQTQGERCEDQ